MPNSGSGALSDVSIIGIGKMQYNIQGVKYRKFYFFYSKTYFTFIVFL